MAARLVAVAKWAVVLSVTVGGQRVVRVVTGVLHIRAVLGSTASRQRVEEFLLLHLLRGSSLQRGSASLLGRPDGSVGCQIENTGEYKRQDKPVGVLLIERRRKRKQRVTKVNSVAAQRRSSSNILEHGIILGHKRRVTRLRTRRSNRKVIAGFSQRRRNRGSLENRRKSVKGSPVQHRVPCVVGRHLAVIHVGAVSNGKRVIGARLGSIVDTRVIIECRKVQERRVCVEVSAGLGEVHFIVLDDLEVRSGLVHNFAWTDSRRNKLLRKVKREHLNFRGFRLRDGSSLNLCIIQRPGVSVGMSA